LERLTFHTLLIELVAKSAEASAIPFETLNRIIKEKFIHHDLLHKRKVETGGHGNSLADNAKRAKVQDYIWLIFENITNIGELQQLILRAFALLPTAAAFTDDFVAKHLKTFGLEEDVYELLDHLVERGWLESLRKDGQPAYKMHPLIADVAVKHLTVDGTFAETYIMGVADLIYYDNANPEHLLSEKKDNLPFAERLTDLFFDENTEGVSELLQSLNWLNQNLGFYEKAAKQGEQALKIAQSLPNTHHALIAKNQSTLAMAYQNLGQYDRAAALLETALASNLKNFGAEHPTVAVYQSNLANVYQNLGQYDRAADLLETALASDLKNFGTEHPKIAIRQNNLAWVYYKTEHRAKAKVLWQAAYANYLKNLGAAHPHTVLLKEYSEMK
jgi:tetratricopeptide (TPR) repeat protein